MAEPRLLSCIVVPTRQSCQPQSHQLFVAIVVVIIFIDDQGYYDLGCYGATEVKTPRIDQLAAERPEDGPTLLLAHNPETLEHAALHRFPLVLSGHTHGGQLALPFARNVNLALLMTNHTRGLYQQGDTTLYVNRGLGVGGPPIRVAATREIGVIELHCG